MYSAEKWKKLFSLHSQKVHQKTYFNVNFIIMLL